jgi:hypothetical protein
MHSQDNPGRPPGVIRWEDPAPLPPPPLRDTWARILTELRSDSKRWALCRTYTSAGSAGSAARRMRLGNPGFEFTSRRVNRAEWGVYGRYVGEEVQP